MRSIAISLQNVKFRLKMVIFSIKGGPLILSQRKRVYICSIYYPEINEIEIDGLLEI